MSLGPNIQARTHTLAHTQAQTHTGKHTCTHTHMHTQEHVHTLAYRHEHVCTDTCTLTHMGTHTYTSTLPFQSCLQRGFSLVWGRRFKYKKGFQRSSSDHGSGQTKDRLGTRERESRQIAVGGLLSRWCCSELKPDHGTQN